MSFGLAAMGVVGVLGLMGGMKKRPKETQTYKSDFEHLTNITTDIIIRTVASTDSSVTNTADITVENSKFLGCIFSVNQTIDSKVSIINNVNSSLKANVLSNLADTITSNIIQQSEDKDDVFKTAIKGWLGSSPDKEKSVDIRNKIETILNNSITDETFSNIFSDVNNKLTSTTKGVTVETCPTELIDKICGGGKCTPQEAANMYEVMCKDQQADGTYKLPPCPISQNIYSNVVAQNIVTKVVEALVDSTVNTDFASYLEQTDRTSGGLDWWVWLLIAGGILVFLFIFFMILRSRKGGGGGNRNNFYRIPDNK